MKHYNNQKTFRFITEPINKHNNYITYNKQAFFKASQNLSPIAFKLYLYIGSFKACKKFTLSKKITCKLLNISSSSYHRSIEELQEKKYIVKDQDVNSTKDDYIYFERPL